MKASLTQKTIDSMPYTLSIKGQRLQRNYVCQSRLEDPRPDRWGWSALDRRLWARYICPSVRKGLCCTLFKPSRLETNCGHCFSPCLRVCWQIDRCDWHWRPHGNMYWQCQLNFNVLIIIRTVRRLIWADHFVWQVK